MPRRHQEEDPGFGTKYFRRTKRIINANGSFNVERRGFGWSFADAYMYLVRIGWTKFLLIVLAAYVTINAFFALLYVLVGVDQIGGHPGIEGGEFLYSFFFSVQTFTTVGYGGMSPTGIGANFVAVFEALIGLIAVAMATGLLFGRFARPSAKVLFAKNALVSPFHETENALMLRVVNRRTSQLINLEAKVMFTMIDPDYTRKYYRLELELSTINMFPLSWTIVHPINKDSVLSDYTAEELIERDAEIIIQMKGWDETFAQEVHTRFSYRFEAVIWGAKFVRMFMTTDEGDIVLDRELLDEWEPAPLNAPLEGIIASQKGSAKAKQEEEEKREKALAARS